MGKAPGRAAAQHHRQARLSPQWAFRRRGRKRGNPYGRSPARSKGFAWHACEAPTVNGPVRDPEERFWFGLSDEIAEAAYPYEDFELADSRVPTEIPEDDLFAGLREGASS